MGNRINSKEQRIAESKAEARHENECFPRHRWGFPFRSLREIILLVAGVLLAPMVSYFTDRPKVAIYFGAVGICVLVLFFAHAWVQSLGQSSGAQSEQLVGPAEQKAPQGVKAQGPPSGTGVASQESPARPQEGNQVRASQQPLADKIQHPRFREDANQITLSFGSNGVHVIYNVEQIKRHGPVRPFNLSGFFPVTIYYTSGELYADVTVYGGSALPPVEIKKNQFVVRPPNWDRNSSENAFEVVNENMQPVFQMIYTTPSHIVINGIFPFPGGLILASDAGMMINPTPPAGFSLKRIFRYPSWKYPGQYEETGN